MEMGRTMNRRASNGYPLAWNSGLIQADIYARAGWRCEHCGMQFPEGSTKACDSRRRDGLPMILTVHHLDGVPSNGDYTNLVALCQRCHLHVQATWRPGQPLPPAWENLPIWMIVRGIQPDRTFIQLRLWKDEPCDN